MLDDAVLLIWDCVARSDGDALPGVLITILVYDSGRYGAADRAQAHASMPVSRSKKSPVAASEMLLWLWINCEYLPETRMDSQTSENRKTDAVLSISVR